jgi:ligand-binding sensor domain-containing protein
MGGRRWYAATEVGVLHSDDEGASWGGGPIGAESSFISVSAHEGLVAAASVHEVWTSTNEGREWTLQPLPSEVKRVFAVVVTAHGEIWAATGAGALRWSGKNGKSGWEPATEGLPARAVTSIRDQDGVLLAAIAGSRCWYVSRDRGKSWSASAPADFEVSGAVMQGGMVYVTTRHHGVVVQKADAPTVGLYGESVAAR